ncbi:MAG: aminotransferase class V-fold PLP-dependent enzyme [Anaerolineales bacterium]|nr:aminotransferase class V-fold PLP-dependent enzyme [Anaerolineales bacterium]
MNMAAVRERFPIFQKKMYMNSCSQGALSVDVKKAYAQYLLDWDEKGSPWELWVEKLEAARQAFAGLINAEGNEVAVVGSVSDAVAGVAGALDYSDGRHKIVVTDFDFPTVPQIWHAHERHGLQVVHVPAAGNRVLTQDIAEAIDERTKLVAIAHVCFRNGSKVNVAEIVEAAHAKGALVLLDAYQSLGTMPLDVKKLKLDFLVGGTLKYLLASSGMAYLYARKELLPKLNPTAVGWFAQANIFAMDVHHHTPSPSARRFEGGSPPVPNLYAALAGIKLVQAVGLEQIESHVREITGAIKEGAMKRGFSLMSPVNPEHHGAMVSLRSHKVDLLVKWLEADNIVVSSRDNNLRLSPHFYNNLADVDRLMDCLTKHKVLLV